jgi:hypothetical protein
VVDTPDTELPELLLELLLLHAPSASSPNAMKIIRA